MYKHATLRRHAVAHSYMTTRAQQSSASREEQAGQAEQIGIQTERQADTHESGAAQAGRQNKESTAQHSEAVCLAWTMVVDLVYSKIEGCSGLAQQKVNSQAIAVAA